LCEKESRLSSINKEQQRTGGKDPEKNGEKRLRRESATDGNFLSARRIRAESEWNNRKAGREEARTELRN